MAMLLVDGSSLMEGRFSVEGGSGRSNFDDGEFFFSEKKGMISASLLDTDVLMISE